MPEATSPQSLPARRGVGRLLRITGAALLAGGVIWFGAVFYQTMTELKQLKGSSSQLSEGESQALVKKISSHMALPNEKPTIATVEDPKKLADQAFFKQAQSGDKVLMYPKHRKAILYRPSVDKIMEVAYLNIEDQAKNPEYSPNGR